MMLPSSCHLTCWRNAANKEERKLFNIRCTMQRVTSVIVYRRLTQETHRTLSKRYRMRLIRLKLVIIIQSKLTTQRVSLLMSKKKPYRPIYHSHRANLTSSVSLKLARTRMRSSQNKRWNSTSQSRMNNYNYRTRKATQAKHSAFSNSPNSQIRRNASVLNLTNPPTQHKSVMDPLNQSLIAKQIQKT